MGHSTRNESADDMARCTGKLRGFRNFLVKSWKMNAYTMSGGKNLFMAGRRKHRD